ncbi:MAG: primosomal protein N' [Lachnospiraceae bacterium]|nr:primosomal protein N' [Lachnospiraceae bacterium]
MANYAGVIVDISLEKLDRVFDYKIPVHLGNVIHPGVQVWIPFGMGNRRIKGFVVSLSDTCDYDACKVKEILGVCEGAIPVEGQLIELAAWMRERYGCTMNQAMKTVLPVKNKVKEQTKVAVSLLVDAAAIGAYVTANKRCKARIRVLQMLQAKGTLEKEKLLEEAATTAATLKELQEAGMISLQSETIYRLPKIAREEKKNIILNKEQQTILDIFRKNFIEEKHYNYLIHGVTGSGKTEVYMGMLETVLNAGKQAIVLIPEIALTFQTVMRFYGRFGDKVSVIHSKMSAGERYDQMERAKKGEISVMIGPRSAVFTPFSNLGMIIIDEEHEGSYKSETMPKYHAREVAKKRCDMSGAALVLGSATPSVESYFKASCGEYQLLKLPNRINDSKLADVQVVDLRQELKEGNRSVISRSLKAQMQNTLDKNQQIMLFLNRRGHTGFISCRSCGKVLKCPHCDVSLTFHRDGRMRCHYCGYEQLSVKNCPECGSPYIGGFRAGTQQIEEVVKKEFPNARILRMDLDTTRKKGSYEAILESFSKKEADILIGTQMIVKGHDFPEVTLVGVLLADLSLHASDYMAAERTFQLLTQVVGRAGRGNVPGNAVIQTYQPEHYAVQSAAKQNYESFYELEIAYRDLMSYPPMSGMLAMLLQSEDEAFLEAEAEKIKTGILEMEIPLLRVTGPTPAVISKLSDIYRRVIYLKHEDTKELYKVREMIEEAVKNETIAKEIRVEFDENPLYAY